MPRIQPRTRILAAGALALALGTTALTQFAPVATAQQAAPLGSAPGTAPGSAPGTAIALPRPVGPDFADLAARVAPAVVRISVTGHAEATPVQLPPEFRGTPFERFFQQRQGPGQGGGGQGGGQGGERRTMGQGSGFIIDG
ncbi:MAG: endopeptidase, partial [Belnapia sp.]|nr:endopeptidase [Belnapia sp.]